MVGFRRVALGSVAGGYVTSPGEADECSLPVGALGLDVVAVGELGVLHDDLALRRTLGVEGHVDTSCAIDPGDAERFVGTRGADVRHVVTQPALEGFFHHPGLVERLGCNRQRLADAYLIAARGLVLLAQATDPLIADGDLLAPPGRDAVVVTQIGGDGRVADGHAVGGVKDRAPLGPGLAGLGGDGRVADGRLGDGVSLALGDGRVGLDRTVGLGRRQWLLRGLALAGRLANAPTGGRPLTPALSHWEREPDVDWRGARYRGHRPHISR